jgi:hypothetical protein
MISKYHNAYAPLWLDISEDYAYVDIIAGDKFAYFEVEVLQHTNTVDIQKYVQALMGDRQSMQYNIFVNDSPYSSPDNLFIATRSAMQIGEASDIIDRVDKILTDRKELSVYDGYPCEISVFYGDPINEIQNVPIDCSDTVISTKPIYSATYTTPICQQQISNGYYAEYTTPVCQHQINPYSGEYSGILCQQQDLPVGNAMLTLTLQLIGLLNSKIQIDWSIYPELLITQTLFVKINVTFATMQGLESEEFELVIDANQGSDTFKISGNEPDYINNSNTYVSYMFPNPYNGTQIESEIIIGI